MANWIFQANPQRYDALRDLREIGDIGSMSVGRHVGDLQPGDRAALWIAGSNQPGVYALGRVTGRPEEGTSDDRWIRPEDRGVRRTFCPLTFDRLLLDRPIPREALASDPSFATARILTQPQATNPFLVTEEEWQAIEERTQQPPPRPARNPAWAYEELVLALDLYVREGLLDDRDPRVVELSELLARLPLHTNRPGLGRFRNPNGVALKLANFAALDPDYHGVGMTRGGRLDAGVWDRFRDRTKELRRLAAEIKRSVLAGEIPTLPVEDEDAIEFEEGRLLYRRHRVRERDGRLTKRKKDAVMRSTGRLVCEACDFDFAETYGEIGRGFIECHHVVPLSETGRTRTTLSDLVLLCSNCHRMVHRRRSWPKLDELRTIVNA